MERQVKVGRPKVSEKDKVKFKLIPVQQETADRIKEVKVKMSKKNGKDVTYTQLFEKLLKE